MSNGPTWNENGSVWKWVAVILFSFVVGLMTGQFMPNSNIATKTQIDSLNLRLDTMDTQIQTLNESMIDMRAQLRTQKILSSP